MRWVGAARAWTGVGLSMGHGHGFGSRVRLPLGLLTVRGGFTGSHEAKHITHSPAALAGLSLSPTVYKLHMPQVTEGSLWLSTLK